MRLIGKNILFELKLNHGDTRKAIDIWVDNVEKSLWKTPSDIKRMYSDASFLAENHVVFNIKGNKYRLIVIVAYSTGTVFAKFAGTHSEYDKFLKKWRK
jgi:mRNA interferase HigB